MYRYQRLGVIVAHFECNVDEFDIIERRVLFEAGRTHRVAGLCVLVNLRRIYEAGKSMA
jgi:hypothetical protein